MKVWFTSDTHFGHRNVIGYCARPFGNVEEMTEELIRRWNERVGAEDVIYHLGDFAIGLKKREMRAILARLNGRKILIAGNHDHTDTRKLPWHCVVERDLQPMVIFMPDDSRVLASHVPVDTWPAGAVHLHGHTHGGLSRANPVLPGRHDVGVDCWGYQPVTCDEVVARRLAA